MTPASIYQLAASASTLQYAALKRLYRFDTGEATSRLPASLALRFGLEEHSKQQVLSVSNLATFQQTWFNPKRGSKPQTCQRSSLEAAHSTAQHGSCDFCQWETCTGEDEFGRLESRHAVTASNLFKACQPCHGLALFKHHEPLDFSLDQLADLLRLAQEWLQAAHSMHPSAQHPLVLWNALHRAGASQYHGHAQLLLSTVPFPSDMQAAAAAERHRQAHPGASMSADTLAAHRTAELLREHTAAGARAYAYASLTPVKDMEVVVHGSALTCPAFQQLLWVVLRAMVDLLGVESFNASISGSCSALKCPPSDAHAHGDGIQARVVSRGKLSAVASDFGALEVLAGASIGATDPYLVIMAIDKQLQDMTGR